jgi:hypothetical protein
MPEHVGVKIRVLFNIHSVVQKMLVNELVLKNMIMVCMTLRYCLSEFITYEYLFYVELCNILKLTMHYLHIFSEPLFTDISYTAQRHISHTCINDCKLHR